MSASSTSKPACLVPAGSSNLKVVKFKPDNRSIYFKNNGLFADNYLINRLPNEKCDSFIMKHWNADDLPAFSECYEWMLSTWEQYKDIFPGLSEAQLEDKWIRPVLEKLGWTYEVQDRLKRRGKTQIPDYSLFASPENYRKAKGCTNNEKYFTYVEAIADAKAMRTNLDGTGRTNANPSYQIVRYLEDTDRDWGILTDGEYWRLYSKNSKSKYTTFYEVNVRKLLSGSAGSPRDDEGFKYFFCFFRQAAFAQRDAAGKSFLDIVYESGERYAQEVETQLKDRAFRIVELIAKGFAGSSSGLSEPELKNIYDSSLKYLFRLLFVFNCESRGLLEVNDMSSYYPHSLRSMAHRLKNEFEGNVAWSSRSKTYGDIAELFGLLRDGDKTIDVFRFGNEAFESCLTGFYKSNKIPDVALNRALLDLACAYGEDGNLQFIDYARLGPDHIGSVFEGLLEYELKYADGTYVVDKKGALKKADSMRHISKSEETIEKGSLYLTNSSGERKATGAYYTPDNIVDFIVEETLAPLCNGKPVDDILKLKVCDLAMGSGHFLLGVIRYLERRTLEKLYETDEKAADIDAAEVRWKLLHNCIFGVDLNPLAVELAKFSLWIYTVRRNFELEPLDDQLKNGDSLVESLDKYPRNFPWQRQFPKVFAAGGFDCIVGNPPYIRAARMDAEIAKYYRETFKCAAGAYDIFVLFYERSKALLRQGGRLGFIVSNKLCVADYAEECRNMLLKNFKLELLMDFTNATRVFKSASVVPVITIAERSDGHITTNFDIGVGAPSDADSENLKKCISPKSVSDILGVNHNFELFGSDLSLEFLKKVDKVGARNLGDIESVRTGIMGFEYWQHEPYVEDGPAGDKVWRLVTVVPRIDYFVKAKFIIA